MPELVVHAVGLISGGPGDGHSRLQGARQHRPGQHRLGRETHTLGDPRPGAPGRVIGPGFGQIQLGVDQRPAQWGGVRQKHPELAVLGPAGRAGVLALHPGRFDALLQESRLIHDQHAIPMAEVLHHIRPQVNTHLPRVPPGVVQQPLHPIRRGVPGRLRQLPAVLALHRSQQPRHIRPRLPPRLDPAEPARHPPEQRIQPRHPRPQIVRSHAIGHTSDYKSQTLVVVLAAVGVLHHYLMLTRYTPVT